jgi:hypothetical protein
MSDHVFERRGAAMATASLVLGVLGLMVVWIPLFGLIAWILSPLGLMLGLFAVARPAGRGAAIAGIICSAVGLVGCFAWAALFGVSIQAGGGF